MLIFFSRIHCGLFFSGRPVGLPGHGGAVPFFFFIDPFFAKIPTIDYGLFAWSGVGVFGPGLTCLICVLARMTPEHLMMVLVLLWSYHRGAPTILIRVWCGVRETHFGFCRDHGTPDSFMSVIIHVSLNAPILSTCSYSRCICEEPLAKVEPLRYVHSFYQGGWFILARQRCRPT